MKNLSFVLAALLSATPLLTSVATAQPDAVPPVAPKHSVFIAGEVFKPGKYDLGETNTLSSLFAFAGGATNNASLDKVEIHRGQIDLTINFSKFKGKVAGGKGDDFALNDGDIIVVPVAKPITVMGNVVKPGIYNLPREGTPSVNNVLALAGGTQTGDGTTKISIIRELTSGKSEAIVGTSKTVVQPGDIVLVAEKPERPQG